MFAQNKNGHITRCVKTHDLYSSRYMTEIRREKKAEETGEISRGSSHLVLWQVQVDRQKINTK